MNGRAVTARILSGLARAGLASALVLGFSGTHNRGPLYGRSSGLSRLAAFPRIVLWAWEKPEDLRFIDPGNAGVAYLSKTITLKGSRVLVRPRLQPLMLPPRTMVMPVVRIELDRSEPATFDSLQLEGAASFIVSEAGSRPADAIQVDFDAPASARPFYRSLLSEVHRRLAPGFPLSITALASWCIGDSWLSDLPVDEAVPMLFRMGADTTPVLNHLASGGDFRARPARSSLGISVDEPISALPFGRRIYIFDPKPWSEGDLKTALSRLAGVR